MFRQLKIGLLIFLLTASSARDTTHLFSIDDALNSALAKEVLNTNISLQFGEKKRMPARY